MDSTLIEAEVIDELAAEAGPTDEEVRAAYDADPEAFEALRDDAEHTADEVAELFDRLGELPPLPAATTLPAANSNRPPIRPNRVTAASRSTTPGRGTSSRCSRRPSRKARA